MGSFFIFICIIIAIVILFKRVDKTHKDVLFMGIFALFIGIIREAITPFFTDNISEQISEMILITAYSSGLSTMLMLVRKLRPELFQYPYILTFSPFFITASFLLVLDAYIIKDLIFMSVQLVLILVALFLLLSSYTDRNNQFVIRVVTGTLILLLSFALYWGKGLLEMQSDFLWQLFAGIGIVMNTDLITSISIINNKKQSIK